jgi:hypothetical protein
MILIPELETVLILVPRCASTALKNAVLAKYPKAMAIYRHMEASGIPHGYDQWTKIGVVRDPVERMWSLFNYIQRVEANFHPDHIKRMRQSTEAGFNHWVVENRLIFCHPHVHVSGFDPYYSVMYPKPENMKSQWDYLRPDLGTRIFQFSQLNTIETRLGIDLVQTNESLAPEMPELGAEARHHIGCYFNWDLKATGRKLL